LFSQYGFQLNLLQNIVRDNQNMPSAYFVAQVKH